MAYDLILGKTKRDWACGEGSQSEYPPTPNPGMEAASNSDPDVLAESTRHEIALTTSLALKLSKAKRLPPADYAAFRKFHDAWNIYSDQHSGKWTPRDNLNLWNLRQINQQFNSRFKVFDTVASIPIKRPESPSTNMVLASSSPGHPVAVLLGAGLAIGALAWLGGKRKYRSV